MVRIWALGFRVLGLKTMWDIGPHIHEQKLERNMEHELEIGIVLGFTGLKLMQTAYLCWGFLNFELRALPTFGVYVNPNLTWKTPKSQGLQVKKLDGVPRRFRA